MNDIDDIIARQQIADVINLYHHIVDGPRVAELGKVFTADAVFDLSEFGHPPVTD